MTDQHELRDLEARIAHAYWEGLEDKKCLTLQGLMLYMIEEKTKATAAQEAE